MSDPWIHAGHEIVFLRPDPPLPGAPYGPHCMTCNESMLIFRVPTELDLERARQWVAAHPELTSTTSCSPQAETD